MTRAQRRTRHAAGALWLLAWLILVPAAGMAQQTLPMLGDVQQIAAGAWHTCALKQSGAVFCWGRNDRGQLGDGSTADRLLPVQVVGLDAGVIAIAAGESHSCAAMDDGSVRCWGANQLGQLGNGETSFAAVSTPVPVAGLGSVRTLSLGDAFSCALRTDDSLWCWGDSSFGQIARADGQYPTASQIASGVSAVSTGDAHTCLLLTSGPLRCVGYALFGQLGRGLEDPPLGSASIQDVVGLQSGVSGIGLGRNHSCATLQSGGLLCWGNNEQGQIGSGSSALRFNLPQPVGGLSGIQQQVVGGFDFSCALDADGGVACWGANGVGQVGSGLETQIHPLPTAVQSLPGPVQALSAGYQHVCALSIENRVLCWGDNRFGQIGDGSVGLLQQASPVEVAGLSDAQSIAAGSAHTCATTAAGAVRCWGANAEGQLGDGSTTRRLAPVAVSGLGSGQRSVAGGESHSCALADDGALNCWGSNRFAQLATGSSALRETQPVSLAGLYAPTSGFSAPVQAITAGAVHSCGLTSQQRVGCWGFTPLGGSDGPIFLLGLLDDIVAVSAGENHNCALTAHGVVRCWGEDDAGQIVNNGVDSPSATVDIQGIGEPAARIVAGGDHSCAVTASQRVVCWGSDQYGEGGGAGPITVDGLSGNIQALAAGRRHNCALSDTGGVRCWGDNAFGQLGNGGATAPWRTAVPVDGLVSGAMAISAGDFHTCALLTTGRIRCWGFAGGGQLGDGQLPGGAALPRAVRIDPAMFRSGFEAGEG